MHRRLNSACASAQADQSLIGIIWVAKTTTKQTKTLDTRVFLFVFLLLFFQDENEDSVQHVRFMGSKGSNSFSLSFFFVFFFQAKNDVKLI